MSSDSPSYRKWLLLAFKLAIVVLVVAGITREIFKAREDFAAIENFSFAAIDFRWLLLAAIAYLVGMLPMGLFWYAVMRSLGQRPHLGETLRAFYIGHLGKYVPGKAMVVVLRTGLVRSGRVDTTVAAVSVFTETLTMMAAGAFLAAVLIAVQFAHQVIFLLLAIGLMLCAGVPTLPPIFRRLVYLLKVRKLNPQIGEHLRGLTWRLMAVGWLGNLIGWSLFGVSLWATVRSIPGASAATVPFVESMPLIMATVCLAMVAGFLSLIPAGMGVREMVIIPLMAPRFGRVVAIVGAVLLRLTWMGAEVLLAGVLYLTVRSTGAEQEQTGEPNAGAAASGAPSQPGGTRS